MASPPQHSTRRFLPQPIETSTKTSKTSRKFVPTPIETSTHSHRSKANNESSPSKSESPRKRFVPKPIEISSSSSRSRRRGAAQAASSSSPPRPVDTPRQKFTPQLIETARRSKRHGDLHPATLPTDKTDISPGDKVQQSRHRRADLGAGYVPQIHESRFSAANLAARARRETPERSHSFRIPDLAPIESQSSETSSDSNCPSLSTSPSASDATDLYNDSDTTRMRESCDDKFSGYLLALAAKAAEKQLREQALLAAYPNEGVHAHVDHFVPVERDASSSDDDSCVTLLQQDEDGDVRMFRSDSSDEMNWGLQEMRKHQEKLQKERGVDHMDGVQYLPVQPKDPFEAALRVARQEDGLDPMSPKQPKHIIGGWQKNIGLDQMRQAASPPMLGKDIKFPKCQSPKQTRFDVHQHPQPQNHNSDNEGPHETQSGGLWTAGNAAPNDGCKGLWRGACTSSANQTLSPPPRNRAGIMTPTVEMDDPFASLKMDMDAVSNSQKLLPPSPPHTSNGSMTGIDSMISAEEEIAREFDDKFVTQIYNYLSLGYPSLAWKFDPELCKISKIPISEIRRDDDKANAKGYIGAPEGNGDLSGVKDGNGGACARWVALKLYIREWARQQRKGSGFLGETTGDWGVIERRGSWAI